MSKLFIDTPTNTTEAIEAVTLMREWCQSYLDESSKWISGVKIAGKKARGHMYNIKNNASTVNKAMIATDKRRKR